MDKLVSRRPNVGFWVSIVLVAVLILVVVVGGQISASADRAAIQAAAIEMADGIQPQLVMEDAYRQTLGEDIETMEAWKENCRQTLSPLFAEEDYVNEAVEMLYTTAIDNIAVWPTSIGAADYQAAALSISDQTASITLYGEESASGSQWEYNEYTNNARDPLADGTTVAFSVNMILKKTDDGWRVFRVTSASYSLPYGEVDVA